MWLFGQADSDRKDGGSGILSVLRSQLGSTFEYLSGLSANDLVIVGALWQRNADAALDTTAIGGSNYNITAIDPSITPLGYMAIGTAGAPPTRHFYTSSGAPTTEGYLFPSPLAC